MHWPLIWFYEFRKFVYILLREPATLRAIFSYLRLAPRTLAKRRLNLSRRQASAKDIRRWFR
jgi:hypothetical protein